MAGTKLILWRSGFMWYRKAWPSHFPKDAFYFYQSQWTDEPMLHIFPHWNWPGKEGLIIPVWCYSNCDSVEILLNGRSMGMKHFKKTSDLYLSWDVPYEPGVLKAIGKKDGKIVCTKEIRTAGELAKVDLTADRDSIIADGQDFCYITVKILDKG